MFREFFQFAPALPVADKRHFKICDMGRQIGLPQRRHASQQNVNAFFRAEPADIKKKGRVVAEAEQGAGRLPCVGSDFRGNHAAGNH